LLKGGFNQKKLEMISKDEKCVAPEVTINYRVKLPIDAMTKILVQSTV